MEFRALSLKDEAQVKEIFARFKHSDIHLDPRYVALFEHFNKQEAVYFWGQGSRGEFLAVYFIRVLPGGQERDLLSPWYYGGPMWSHATLEEAKAEFPDFLSEMESYAKVHGILGLFQRLNPSLGNEVLYEGDPSLVWNRNIVVVDLTKSMETIRSEYDYKVRKNLRRAQASGLYTTRDKSPEAIAAFIKVYTASMERKKAGAFYYFNEQFYKELFEAFPEEAQLFVTYAGNDVAAAELVLGNGTILHDYLRAAYPEYLAMRPNECTVDAIIEWAHGAGYKEFSIGGGVSASPDDPLFKYKNSLSPALKDYYLYKKVLDREAYTKRCVAEGMLPEDIKFEQADPFPEYKTA